jgi:hypothetical protein
MAWESRGALTRRTVVNKEAYVLLPLLLSALSPAVPAGAGISTESGVPDYRGPQGAYTRHGFRPMTHQQVRVSLMAVRQGQTVTPNSFVHPSPAAYPPLPATSHQLPHTPVHSGAQLMHVHQPPCLLKLLPVLLLMLCSSWRGQSRGHATLLAPSLAGMR